MGCTSELGGNTGIVWFVESTQDLDHILSKGPTPPYTAVLTHEFYTRQNLLSFRDRVGRVAGVIFIDGSNHSNQRTTPFSPEDTCPNRYSGLYVNDTDFRDCKKNVWQKESQVSGLLYDDIPYPIFYINDKKSIDSLVSCFNDFNLAKQTNKREQGYFPFCSVQLDSFMLAASNSKSCLTSHSLVDELLQTNGIRCATVENQNVFGYLKPTKGLVTPSTDNRYVLPSTVDPKSIVLVIAKLSSVSMFTEISPGADSTITSIITLLAVAEALGKVKSNAEVTKSNRNVAFALLDSEPFDYTGSSRMVANMADNTFPNSIFKQRATNITETVQNMNLTSIDYIIDLDQLALYPNSDTIYLHSDPLEKKNENKLRLLKDLMSSLAKESDLKLEAINDPIPLPPTSVQEFLRKSRKLNTDSELVGVVLGNYGKTYNNLFYNSMYDDSKNIDQVSREKLVGHLTKIASFVAKSVFKLAFKDEKTESVAADSATVEELLSCYLLDANCVLFTKVWQAGLKLPDGPVQTYNDPTKQSDDMNGAITTHLLSYFLSDKYPEYNISRCALENKESYVYNYQYINGISTQAKEDSGLCIGSQVFNTRSDSPAFVLGENSLIIDQEYAAWTISLNSIRYPVRIFLQPSTLHQWAIFLLGVLTTVISFLVVYQLKISMAKMSVGPRSQPVTST